MTSLPPQRFSSWKLFFIFLLLGIVTLIVFFHHSGQTALVAADSAPYWVEGESHSVKNGFFNLWAPQYQMGDRYGPISPDHNLAVLTQTSFPFSLSLLYTTNILLAGLGGCVLLRSLKLSSIACLFGGMALLLSNGMLTLIYPGHVTKIISYAWFPFSIAAFLYALDCKKIRMFILSGAFLGLGVLGGEVQICYYLGFWYGVWAIAYLYLHCASFSSFKKPAAIFFTGLILIALCSLGLGLQKTLHYLFMLRESPPIVGAESDGQNWAFATQFYFPPEEILSYITTIQFFGAPNLYWGRDGSPTPLRLSDDYMGLLPLGFAVIGAITCWRIWQARLFIFMAIGSLLISFGREGGLFWILYQLPTMKSQRNPHRWSYFVSLAVCILAGYGVNWLYHQLMDKRHQEVPDKKKKTPSPILENRMDWTKWRRALLSILGVGVVLAGVSFVLLTQAESVARFYYGVEQVSSAQGPLFIERAHMLLGSLVRTGLFAGLSAATLWVLIGIHERLPMSPSKSQVGGGVWIAWGLLLVVMMSDLGLNAKRYIVFYPWKDAYFKNEIVNFLKQDPDLFRVKVVGNQQSQQAQLLNDLVTNILPFHGISVVDPPSMSRMPTDYAKLYDHLKNHYVRSDHYFDFFNVKYVLSTEPFSDSHAKFNLVAQAYGVNIYKREDFMPRAWLATNAVVIKEDAAAIARSLYPTFDLRETVVLQEAPSLIPVEDSTKTAKAIATKKDLSVPVRFLRHEDNRMEMEASNTQPSMLVLGEKWDSDWKAWVDGVPAKIYRANYLMRGLELSPGQHKILMEYRPSMTGFWISAISVGIFSIWGLFSGIGWLTRRFHVNQKVSANCS